MKITIKNSDIQHYNDSSVPDFPKYTSQLMNWANQNAQGTRPRVVGQLSELFSQYRKECGDGEEISIGGWERWYSERYPDSIDEAADKIFHQMEHLKEAIQLIDLDMIRRWVYDLVITKTYNGLYIQKAILARLAEEKGTDYRLACPEEESQGIDGYVGETAYSIKPDTYRAKNFLPETIGAKMIYYAKTKTGLTVEVEE